MCPYLRVVKEHFDLFFQRFDPNRREICYGGASFGEWKGLVSGRTADGLQFLRPFHIRPFDLHTWEEQVVNSCLFRELDGLSDPEVHRVVRSCRLFIRAYCSEPSMGLFERTILLVAAIQTLRCPGIHNKKDFAQALVTGLGCEKDLAAEGVAQYGEKLYELRSRFSHGAQLTEKHVQEAESCLQSTLWLYGQMLVHHLKDKADLTTQRQISKHLTEHGFTKLPSDAS